MRTAWILRHAKAVAHSDRDHGRNLAARGRRQCEELSAHLATLAARPSLVVTSSAARALQTAQGILDALGPGVELEVDPALYQADPDDVLDLLRRTDDERSDVMVVGHNPTFVELVDLALDPADGAGRRSLEGGLPTGALAVVGFEVGRWAELALGGGRLVELYVPKAR